MSDPSPTTHTIPPPTGTNEHGANTSNTLLTEDPPAAEKATKIDRGRLGPAANGVRQCGAISKSTGTPCPNPCVTGANRCRLHGGLAPGSGGQPRYKHGRYSKVLPHNLRETYESAREDDQLMSLRDELSLMKARLVELAGRLKTGEGKTLWEDLLETYEALTAAIRAGETERMMNALLSLGELIKNGNDNEQTWVQIQETLDGTARVSAAEWKRMVDLRQMISAEKAIGLVMAVTAAVQRHCKNPMELSAIHREIAALISFTPRQQPAIVEAEPDAETAGATE